MIFKQFFDPISSTFTYLLAKAKGSEALIIDPVLDRVDDYLKFLGQNNLKLVVAMDTHIHADHKTGLGQLRNITRCMTCLSEQANTSTVSRKLTDGDSISIDGIELKVFYTPGHTNDSCCFYAQGMVFTGDTLFIRGNGRTDFQNGDAGQLYDSISEKLFTLPDDTMVWPGHDYKGEHASTIGREKLQNPRYFNKTREAFIEIMDNLNLPNPKLMDIAVPFNQHFGDGLGDSFGDNVALKPEQLASLEGYLLVDLREEEEVKQVGTIENSIRIPLRHLEAAVRDLENMINHAEGVVFFCAHGERSALALEMTRELGFKNGKHLVDGIAQWIETGHPVIK
ncbi:MAG: MBL fold metallo-hydrolase [Enterobacterales bacterium]|nr:MBL fold metallo-hydrolase [Enterobacterales bacterium]